MKNEKSSIVSKSSIVFYVVAVLFLFATLFSAYTTYQTVAAYQAQGEITMDVIISGYLSNCGPFLAFAFILYGIGLILSKFSFLNETLANCMVESTEESNDHELEDDAFISELQSSSKAESEAKTNEA